MEGDLDTVVSHLTHVGEEFGISERRDGDLVGVEEVAGSRHVSVDCTAEPSAEHREVDTCIHGVLCLPLEVRVGVGVKCVSGDGSTVVGGGSVGRHEGE